MTGNNWALWLKRKTEHWDLKVGSVAPCQPSIRHYNYKKKEKEVSIGSPLFDIENHADINTENWMCKTNFIFP